MELGVDIRTGNSGAMYGITDILKEAKEKFFPLPPKPQTWFTKVEPHLDQQQDAQTGGDDEEMDDPTEDNSSSDVSESWHVAQGPGTVKLAKATSFERPIMVASNKDIWCVAATPSFQTL